MIRALLFDLGNVLIYFSHQRMMQQVATLLGVGIDALKQLFFHEGLLARYETGQLVTDQLVIELNRIARQRADPAAIRTAASDIFWRNESIEPVIDRLAASGRPLIMVSNTSEVHRQWVDERFAIVRHFQRRALSYEVGAVKPDPRIFQRAVELAGVPAQECFFTDDTPAYVEAARALGLDAHVYTDTPTLVEVLASRGVLQLP
jgi:putative hydrolase of the HAD superfamily